MSRLKELLENMREAGNLRQEEAMDLASQLNIVGELDCGPSDAHVASTSTSGMTELNPEVLEQVRRLERENAALLARCDEESAGSVENLRRNALPYGAGLKALFEDKYHNAVATKDRLKLESSTHLKRNASGSKRN